MWISGLQRNMPLSLWMLVESTREWYGLWMVMVSSRKDTIKCGYVCISWIWRRWNLGVFLVEPNTPSRRNGSFFPMAVFENRVYHFSPSKWRLWEGPWLNIISDSTDYTMMFKDSSADFSVLSFNKSMQRGFVASSEFRWHQRKWKKRHAMCEKDITTYVSW